MWLFFCHQQEQGFWGRMRSALENKDITICCRFESWCIHFNHSPCCTTHSSVFAVTPNAEFCRERTPGWYRCLQSPRVKLTLFSEQMLLCLPDKKNLLEQVNTDGEALLNQFTFSHFHIRKRTRELETCSIFQTCKDTWKRNPKKIYKSLSYHC